MHLKTKQKKLMPYMFIESNYIYNRTQTNKITNIIKFDYQPKMKLRLLYRKARS